MTARPRLLDLCCGGGGASRGYALAGFEVVGVDIEPQPHYPYEFHQADALTFPLDGFDAVHSSPPCQDYSATRHLRGRPHGTADLLPQMLERLRASRLPWVVENVPGSEHVMGDNRVTLCGSAFGLGVRRHRVFATSFWCLAPPCSHRPGPTVDVTGHGRGISHARRQAGRKLYSFSQAERRAAMGIDWLNRDELAQAIPPAYTQFLGEELRATIEAEAVA